MDKISIVFELSELNIERLDLLIIDKYKNLKAA